MVDHRRPLLRQGVASVMATIDGVAVVAEGLRNSAVADRLHLSEKSMEKHINSIFSKLNLTDETESNRQVRPVLL